jgi:ribosomal protein S18 acetylase RimI-like enzyme
MKDKINLADITIRTELIPGDIGYITYLHGYLYQKEYNYGINFEAYVAKGLAEFWQHYDQSRDRVWVCEHDHNIVGFLLLMHRETAAQLRYFILDPGYRGIGLGKKLMDLYMDFLKKQRYTHSYLWTAKELFAAAHLYTSHGFTLTEEKESETFGKKVIEQRYDLVLNYEL